MSAALEKRIAELEARLAAVETCGPVAAVLRERQRGADVAARAARIRSLVAMEPAARAVAILDAEDLGALGLGRDDVLRLLAGLEIDGAAWTKVATVADPRDVAAARIAAEPAIPRVTLKMAKPWDTVRLEQHIDAATERELRGAGLERDIYRSRRGDSMLDFTLRGAEAREPWTQARIYTAEELAALTAALPELGEAIAEGRVTVEALSDEASRSIDLRAVAP